MVVLEDGHGRPLFHECQVEEKQGIIGGNMASLRKKGGEQDIGEDKR